MTIRCKFKCISKTERVDYRNITVFDYKFSAVTQGSPENEQFFKYTPSGSLDVSTVNNGSFEINKEYYLDLSVVE